MLQCDGLLEVVGAAPEAMYAVVINAVDAGCGCAAWSPDLGDHRAFDTEALLLRLATRHINIVYILECQKLQNHLRVSDSSRKA